jgi:hypothetical protein
MYIQELEHKVQVLQTVTATLLQKLKYIAALSCGVALDFD